MSNTREDSLSDEAQTTTPSISKIYSEAARYEEFFEQDGDIPSEQAAKEDGFTKLVGRDLGSTEDFGRLANFIAVSKDSWIQSELTQEPDSYESDSTPGDTPPASADVSDEEGAEPSHPKRSETKDSESWKLPPEEVIDLLVEEFGPLAVEGEQETLILETDGAFFRNIVILGVVHLTTHRLTFHATLLSARPDLLPSQQIIKSGPVTIHRKGFLLNKKRRVWLELSHDMISAYASSRDEDRIRPLRSILLSSIKDIGPAGPERPKWVKLVFSSTDKKKQEGFLEFDNEEAAMLWTKELQGALFMYRHMRRRALQPDAEDNGVRISIPLSSIKSFSCEERLQLAYLISLQFDIPPEVDGPYPGLYERCSPLQFGTIRPDRLWLEFGDIVERAKNAPKREDAQGILVDFGPLSFLESGSQECGSDGKAVDIQDEREKAVRRNLAMQAETDLWIMRARIHRNVTSSGYLALSSHYLGFWSKYVLHADIRYRIPLHKIKNARSFSNRLLHVDGMKIEIEGQADLNLQFRTAELRDEAIRRINAAVSAERLRRAHATSQSGQSSPSGPLTPNSPTGGKFPGTPVRSPTGILSPLSRTIEAAVSQNIPPDIRLQFPKPINLPSETLVTPDSMHFICLTIGSRGDVQPYIALALGLKKEGHRVTIVTHEEYKTWVEGFGIAHRTAGGDPGALMKLSVENKMFSPEFFKESIKNFRPWLDQLLIDAWEQCQDADVLLESPSAMAGVHISEALNIPYFRCFTMPWTKTTEFPHAFLSSPVDAPAFNAGSYVLFDNVMWTATSGQINRWRRKTLQIGNTDMGHLAQSKITFIYNFSPAVVPKPLDWGETTIVSGYWFLDNPDLDWTPPPSLVEWMAKARADGKPIVYIGFGSITVPHPATMTDHIVKAVLKSGVRAIISKGWSARMSKDNEPEVVIPPECYQLDKVPHDWLFPQIDAALHHGGAGTTGASLRAGIPTLIKPWFGDQYFWASRVHKLGAGLRVPSLRVNDLAEALTKATTNRLMKEKAAGIGERIRSEDGVHMAIDAIYTWLPRARRNRQSLD